jgi:hypothetical protein
MENIELQHHGTKGQKWGVRRFQNKDGSLTPEGKKRYGIIGSIKERSAAKKRQKQRAAALEKAREVKKTKAEEAAEKKRVLESGTADEVMRYKGQLSNKELSDAYSRLNYERLISDLSSKDVKSGAEQVDSLMTKAEKMVGAAQKGLDTYNKAAKIVNAVSKADLPTFEGNKKTKAAESALDKLVKSGTAEQIQKQFGKLSSKQLQDANTRLRNEDMINERIAKEKADKEKAAKLAEAQKQVDEYNRKWASGELESSTYSKAGKEIIDSRLETGKKVSDVKDTETLLLGQTYIAGLLEDKSGR